MPGFKLWARAEKIDQTVVKMTRTSHLWCGRPLFFERHVQNRTSCGRQLIFVARIDGRAEPSRSARIAPTVRFSPTI